MDKNTWQRMDATTYPDHWARESRVNEDQGIYRALVAHRARDAVKRGYRYLQVDASRQSRPVLERLGFEPLTTTTPYVYEP